MSGRNLAAVEPLRVDLITADVVIHGSGEWCPTCALPSAWALSFTLVTIKGELVRRFEHVVICADCNATVSMSK